MIELRDGVTVEEVLKELRYAAGAAANISGEAMGGGAGLMLDAYFRWTENAERMLGNVLSPEMISDLVHTRRFWALRASTGVESRLIPMVMAEIETRQRELHGLIASLEAERARWADGKAMLVVPDTNMFLQNGEPFEALKWLDSPAFGANVCVVVPIVVIHELDRLKREGNNSARSMARASIRWLTEKFPAPGPGSRVMLGTERRAVTLEAYVTEGPMRPHDPDGVVIAVARWLQIASEKPTRLVTRDLGMRLRARLSGVEAVQLPDPEPGSR